MLKKKILLILLAILSFSFMSAPTFAAKEGDSCTCSDGRPGTVVVDTAILSGCDCDGGNGGSAIEILNLIVDIMTVGIGILGVIGITIVGIQYLTAGDSEEKVRTAKRRLFEIVIGLAAYAVIYALLQWLLPGFG